MTNQHLKHQTPCVSMMMLEASQAKRMNSKKCEVYPVLFAEAVAVFLLGQLQLSADRVASSFM